MNLDEESSTPTDDVNEVDKVSASELNEDTSEVDNEKDNVDKSEMGESLDLSLNLDTDKEEDELQFEEENCDKSEVFTENDNIVDDGDFFEGENKTPRKSESRASAKHVSFNEETEIYEPIVESYNEEEDDDDDEAEDERGGCFDTPRSDDDF